MVPPTRKIAFVLAGGDVHYVQIPLMKEISALFKKETVISVFLNKDDPNCQNMILIMVKKKRTLKLYQYEIAQEKITIQEKKSTNISLDSDPKCALWTSNNYFVYFSYPDGKKGMNFWINLDDPQKRKFNEIEDITDICCLGDKVAVSSEALTLFMSEGVSYQYNPISHAPLDFKKFCEFKNHLFALYSNSIRVYKASKQEYEPVDFLSLNNGETAKFIVASKSKLIVVE